MSGTDYVSAINVDICRSVVPGRAGGHVPGRSAAYENQALVLYVCLYLSFKSVLLEYQEKNSSDARSVDEYSFVTQQQEPITRSPQLPHIPVTAFS